MCWWWSVGIWTFKFFNLRSNITQFQNPTPPISTASNVAGGGAPPISDHVLCLPNRRRFRPAFSFPSPLSFPLLQRRCLKPFLLLRRSRRHRQWFRFPRKVAAEARQVEEEAVDVSAREVTWRRLLRLRFCSLRSGNG